MRNKITVHTLVKNEERYLWYAVASIISHVDEILLWDNGSTDNTPQIINELRSNSAFKEKINHRRVETDLRDDFETILRQEMLDATTSDWILIVDGDEIWWEDSINQVTRTIFEKGEVLESIVVPTINVVGDMYHYLGKDAGRYKLAGREGHLNLRALSRSIPGLKSWGKKWDWGWADSENIMIHNRNPEKIGFADAPYLHTTHLLRSIGKKDSEVYRRNFKTKYELGKKFSNDYYYPEVFFRPKPDIVFFPWSPMSKKFFVRSVFETPLRKMKRFLKKNLYG